MSTSRTINAKSTRTNSTAKQTKKKSKRVAKSKATSNPQQNEKPQNIWGVKLKKNKKNVKIEPKYKVGDFVLLNNDREGIIGYVGNLDNTRKNKIYYGIELLNGSIGNSDGTYLGKRYFKTLSNRAIFITIDKIRRIMVGKDYNTPRRLDRRYSLQHRRHSSVSNKRQSQFELAIYDITKMIEVKCDQLDAIAEESNDLSSETLLKKTSQKRGRKKGKKGKKSMALSEIRKKYEENAKNIDNERNKKLEINKQRKSFNKIKLDLNVKSAAISGFKKKLKKQNEKEKMKEMFKNENEAIMNSKSMVEQFGFLKYLNDYEIYSHLFNNHTGKTKKGVQKKFVSKTKNIPSAFTHVYMDPSEVKFCISSKKMRKGNAKNRDIDHSVLINKISVPRTRRKKTRKKITFDDNGDIVSIKKMENGVHIVKTEGKIDVKIEKNEKKIDAKIENNIEYKNDNQKVCFVEQESKMSEINEEYEVFDMTNSNVMLLFSESNVEILQNVICAAIRNVDTLQVLEMSNCGMDDIFLDKICAALIDMTDMNNIWCLNIQSNPIGDKGMLSLCELIARNNKCLTHIKLQNNRKDISTSVCQEICNSLQLNQYIKVFEFEFRHYQFKDKCKKVLWRNNEAARKLLRAKKK